MSAHGIRRITAEWIEGGGPPDGRGTLRIEVVRQVGNSSERIVSRTVRGSDLFSRSYYRAGDDPERSLYRALVAAVEDLEGLDPSGISSGAARREPLIPPDGQRQSG